MAIVAARNTIFIRHLSPQVSESILRQAFGQCDTIEQVLFRAFPGRTTEYYAQIDFRSSTGVVEAHKMSGTPILGVVCQVSVVDPASADMMRKAADAQKKGEEELEKPSIAEPTGVQAEYIRKYRAQAESKRLRTVHVAGLDKENTEAGLRALCMKFGEVEAIRMDEDGEGKPFALVEFKEIGPATVCKSRQGFIVDDKTIVFTEAKTMIDTNAFVEQSVHFLSPFFDASELKQRGAQSRVDQKLLQARLIAAEITNEPLPEELKQACAQSEDKASAAPEDEPPMKWEGRSEKDFLRDLAMLSRRPPREERERSRRQRRRESRSRSRRRRRRRSGSPRRPCGERKRRTDVADGSAERPSKGRKIAEEPKPDTFDVDDLELAVVPNTELLVLGESSSYSSGSPSPDRAGVGAPASSSRQDDGAVAASAASAGSSGALMSAVLEAPDAPELAVDINEVGTAVCAEKQAMASVMDVDAKEQWLPPVDVDEEGSCDEVIDMSDDVHQTSAAPPADTVAAAIVAGGVVVGACQQSDLEGVASPIAAGSPASSADIGVSRLGVASSQAPAGLPGMSPVDSPSDVLDRWECEACGEVNKNTRDRCNNCGGPAPWITIKSPDGDGIDELSSACSSSSSPTTPSPAKSVGESAPRSVADVAESPARSVEESPPRSVAASGSCRSVAESEPPSVADLADDSDDEARGRCVDLLELERQEAEECVVEAERVRGEFADARARIFHSAS